MQDLMVPITQLESLDVNTKLEKIIGIISNNGIGCAYVTNKENKNSMIGLITDGDLRRALKKNKPENWSQIKAIQMMTKNPLTIEPEILAIDALHYMKNQNKGISVLPVLNKSKKEIVGILRLHDIVKSGLK